MQRNSRGGEKPSMLGNNGNPLAIQINGIARKDWYEISNNGGLLARRVELPTWLSEKAHQIKAERKSLLAELSEKKYKASERRNRRKPRTYSYRNKKIYQTRNSLCRS